MNLLLAKMFENVKFDKAFNVTYIFKSVVSKWYLYVALALVIVGVVILACKIKPPKRHNLSSTQRIAYLSIFCAICVVVNILQIPTPLMQLSFVATVCAVGGILLGATDGFIIGFVGDLIAGIIAPMGVYSPIIGIGTGFLGLVPGLIFSYVGGKDFIKVIISFAITFVVTSLILNTIGLSIIYPKYYVLLDRFALLPFTLLFHAINCLLTIGIIKLLKRTLPKNKFSIDK